MEPEVLGLGCWAGGRYVGEDSGEDSGEGEGVGIRRGVRRLLQILGGDGEAVGSPMKSGGDGWVEAVEEGKAGNGEEGRGFARVPGLGDERAARVPARSSGDGWVEGSEEGKLGNGEEGRGRREGGRDVGELEDRESASEGKSRMLTWCGDRGDEVSAGLGEVQNGTGEVGAAGVGDPGMGQGGRMDSLYGRHFRVCSCKPLAPLKGLLQNRHRKKPIWRSRPSVASAPQVDSKRWELRFS